jgi:hypothetical protein
MSSEKISAGLLSSVAGLGVPQDASSDSCRIIQGESQELKRGEKRYLPDARVGDFRFEGREPPTIDGETGFRAQILHARPAFVETPAAGSLGTLNQYKHQPGDASWIDEVDKFGNKKKVFRRASNRNIIVRTVFLTMTLVGEDAHVDYDQVYVLRVNGKGLTLLEEQFTKPLGRRSMRITGDNGVLHKPPLFGVIVRITSTLTSNNWGDWYIPSVTIIGKCGDVGGPTEDEFATALETYKEREAHAALSYALTPGALEPPAPPDAFALIQPAEQPPKPVVTPTPKLGSPEAASRFTSGSQPTGSPKEDGAYYQAQPFAPLPDQAPEGPDYDNEITF